MDHSKQTKIIIYIYRMKAHIANLQKASESLFNTAFVQ